MPGNPEAGIGTIYLNTSTPVEDVTDIIYQITPEDTPFFNMTGDTGVRDIFHQWQVRSLTTRQVNAAPEGFSWTFTSPQRLPTRLGNHTQIFEKDARVSNTQQAVEHYAVGDMFADQMQQAMIEFKTDMEHALLQGTLASGNTNAARYMQGMINHVVSGVTTYSNFSSSASLSETSFNDMIELSWNEGGEPRDVFVHGPAKREISTFTAGHTKFIPSDQQRTVNTQSMYESDFFTVQIHLSRDIPKEGTPAGYSGHGVLFVDRSMARKAWLRQPVAERAPKTADSHDGIITGEVTLEVGNRSAHTYIDRAVIL
jgi:hypothetical protein